MSFFCVSHSVVKYLHVLFFCKFISSGGEEIADFSAVDYTWSCCLC